MYSHDFTNYCHYFLHNRQAIPRESTRVHMVAKKSVKRLPNRSFSIRRAFCFCFFTVSTVIPNSSAISLAEYPCIAREKTFRLPGGS